MKKILLALLIVVSFALVPASLTYAADWDLVEDIAGILTAEQASALLDQAEAISEKYQCDVAIVTLDEMTDDDGAYEWAKYIYEEYNFGYGADKSGVLFFLSMAERDYSLIAYGYGNTAFTDHGKDVLVDDRMLPLLADDKYFEAFAVYLTTAEEFLQAAKDGEPFDVSSDPESQRTEFMMKLAANIIVPLLIAWVICAMWKSQMKTAKIARTASNYIPPGGFKLTGQADMFLYRTETRTKIEKQSSGSGGTTTDSKGYSGKSGKF